MSPSPEVTLWHRTTSEFAAKILAVGFLDGRNHYLTDTLHEGVWLSNVPLRAGDGDGKGGHLGETLLRVRLRGVEADIADYEWIAEPDDEPDAEYDAWLAENHPGETDDSGEAYREWLAPAELVNGRSTVEVVAECVNCGRVAMPTELERGECQACVAAEKGRAR